MDPGCIDADMPFSYRTQRYVRRYRWPLLVSITILLVYIQWRLNIPGQIYKWSWKTDASSRPPHIIFILADDYGYNDVGYHGSEIRTPNLDKLSAQGVRLENYYVQPICSPTRGQLMSGRYQIHTGMQHNVIRPPQPFCHPVEDKTLPQALKDVGYSTHIVGKWHMGMYKKECWPTRRGFDTFFGFLGGQEDHFTHSNDICGMDLQLPACKSWPPGLDLRNNEDTVYNYTGVYSTHLFTSHAQMIIEAHDSSKPLFLYVSYQAVHKPLQVPKRYTDLYKDLDGGQYGDDRRIYAGMTTCMDEGVGNITQTLKKMGLWEDTVLIFSSDNGGQVAFGGNNWPLRGMKNSLWEGGMRAVGFVTSALLDDSVKGTVYKGLLHVTDWFPTLVDGLNGGAVSGLNLDGYDVWNAIRMGSKSPRTEILHNIDPLIVLAKSITDKAGFYDDGLPHNAKFNASIRAAVRVGDWKLLTGDPGDRRWVPPPGSSNNIHMPTVTESTSKHLWLFNIAEDPNETRDLSQSHTDIVKQLYHRLHDYSATAVRPLWPDPDWKADPSLHNRTWSNWE